MEVLLHKVCGRPASRTMTLRAAGPEDAAAFYALQNEVRAAMPHPEQFVPDTLENIARYLKEDLCIGGWDGGRLGAYFILRYCGQDAHNYAAFMGIPREEWDGWANADSAIVHPDYRGNGLQRKLLEAALARLRPGIVGIGATVSPENQYSLNNALSSGFEIVCRREMYGGYDRYLLAKALSVTFGDTARVAAPSVCFAVACILLAAAPTAPPCFRRWRRSSPLLPKGEALACRSSPCWTSKT